MIHRRLRTFLRPALLGFLSLALGSSVSLRAESMYVSYVGGNIGRFDTLTGANLGIFASGLDSPRGLTFDPLGNLYVANINTSTINKITPDGTVTVFASGGGLNFPFAMTIDVTGHLYASNLGDNTISKIAPDGTVSLYASGLSQPYGLAFGPDGLLYAANRFDATISQIAADGSVSLFASGSMNYPIGLAFSGGSLFAANSGCDAITRISADGTANFFAVGNGLSFPMGLAADQSGNLYAANFGAYSISKITPYGAVTFFANTDGGPAGIAFAPSPGIEVVPVPEPGVAALAVFGLLARVAGARPRRKVAAGA